MKVDETDRSGDFSAASAETYSEPPATPLRVDLRVWEDKVRKYTAPFQRHGNIYDVRGTLSANRETRWFVSSDGAAIQTTEAAYRLTIAAFSKANDGMELPRFESFYSSTLEGLPDDDTVLKTVQKMIEDLRALKIAPLMEPYIGPAILSPRATGVYFHEIFGHRIEGNARSARTKGRRSAIRSGRRCCRNFCRFMPIRRCNVSARRNWQAITNLTMRA